MAGLVPAIFPADRGRLAATPLARRGLDGRHVAKTRANVRACRTIPSATEIVVLRTGLVTAEILRRAPNGAWPWQPEVIAPDSILRLDRIGYASPLRDANRISGLA